MNSYKTKARAVAITGMGIVSSVGKDISAFREALFRGHSCFTRSYSYPELSFPILGAFIANFQFAQALAGFSTITKERRLKLEKMARSLPYPLQVTLIAGMEAWRQARIQQHSLDPTRIGLVIAAQNTACRYQYDLYNDFQKAPDYLSPSYALHFMDTDYVGVLSDVFGILGEGFTVGGASACGNVALLRAYQLIRDEWQEACLVAGALADLSPMELQGFHNLGALGGHRFAETPNQACRPFDQAHEGFIYGQAAACLLLESLDSVAKRNVPILGYLLGGSLVLDGNRLSNPSKIGEIRVMQEAMRVAGVQADEIDYINTHGTSAPLGDQVEIEAIESIFGEHVILNSSKSILGHCLWSAGIVEAIATIIQLQEGFIHPTLNLTHPITEKSRFVTEKSKSLKMNVALSNAFGFGGINTTIVLSKIYK